MPNDVAATVNCLRALECDGNGRKDLECRESGTTARMVMSIAAALGTNATMKLGEGLTERPMLLLEEAFSDHGVTLKQDHDRIYIDGRLRSGRYVVRGDMSSQFISGLLLALSVLCGDSEVIVTGKPKSVSYIGMTRSTMSRFGVETGMKGNSSGQMVFTVPGAQEYVYPDGAENILEGDWSSGAMWLTAASLLGQSADSVRGLNSSSIQGDRRIMDILARFDEAERKGDLQDIEIDASDIPDIVPAIALRSTVYGGTTSITNAERLRLKECDRLDAVSDILGKCGADIKETKDGLIIRGTGDKPLAGSDDMVDTRRDHRMVMMAAFASIITKKPVCLSDPEAAGKSYPDFFKAVAESGGRIWE